MIFTVDKMILCQSAALTSGVISISGNTIVAYKSNVQYRIERRNDKEAKQSCPSPLEEGVSVEKQPIEGVE